MRPAAALSAVARLLFSEGKGIVTKCAVGFPPDGVVFPPASVTHPPPLQQLPNSGRVWGWSACGSAAMVAAILWSSHALIPPVLFHVLTASPTTNPNRSCTLSIAWLMLTKGLDYDEAYARVRGGRPICAPNTGFICSLLEWQRRRQKVRAWV